jgi:hypothetical protein
MLGFAESDAVQSGLVRPPGLTISDGRPLSFCRGVKALLNGDPYV